MSEKFHCILVKDKEERATAMEAGWDRKNCILPRRVFLEGRRIHSLTITWGALDWLIDTRDTDYLMAVIHQNITVMREKVPVRIDNPNVPPPHKHDWDPYVYGQRRVCRDPKCPEKKDEE